MLSLPSAQGTLLLSCLGCNSCRVREESTSLPPRLPGSLETLLFPPLSPVIRSRRTDLITAPTIPQHLCAGEGQVCWDAQQKAARMAWLAPWGKTAGTSPIEPRGKEMKRRQAGSLQSPESPTGSCSGAFPSPLRGDPGSWPHHCQGAG